MKQGLGQSTIPYNNLDDMNEYLLVIHPDDEVYNKVTVEKQSFYSKYRQKISVKTKPHITAMINYSRKTFCESFTAP